MSGLHPMPSKPCTLHKSDLPRCLSQEANGNDVTSSCRDHTAAGIGALRVEKKLIVIAFGRYIHIATSPGPVLSSHLAQLDFLVRVVLVVACRSVSDIFRTQPTFPDTYASGSSSSGHSQSRSSHQ